MSYSVFCQTVKEWTNRVCFELTEITTDMTNDVRRDDAHLISFYDDAVVLSGLREKINLKKINKNTNKIRSETVGSENSKN